MLAFVLGVVEVEVLCVAVMPAASPVEELGEVELDGVVAELELALVPLEVGLVGVVALLWPLGVVAPLVELGALEAAVDAL